MNSSLKRRKTLLNKHYKKVRKEMNASLITNHREGLSFESASFVSSSTKNPEDSDQDSTFDLTEEISYPDSISDNDESNRSINSLSSHGSIEFEHDTSQIVNLYPQEETNKSFSGCSGSENDLRVDLASWALKHNVTLAACTDLLHILKQRHPNLPADSRTLLHTQRVVSTTYVEPGHYYHFGFVNCLKKLLNSSNGEIKNSDSIEICINVDGLPLSKSSGSQLYPILCNLFLNKNAVNVIGIYHGNEKPKEANLFLKAFVVEANTVLRNGFYYNGNHFKVKIKAFICDVPAKSYIKYTKGHSGYMSCSKCFAEGTFKDNRVCFPTIVNLRQRTDESFRLKEQESHHIGTSVLETLPNIDMIKDFPLDYMHLVCLGVVKKLIVNLWLNGRPHSARLSHKQILDISDALLKQMSNIPCEFVRKSRSLNEAKRWKATEFRLFLLYTGPVVLKNCISKGRYTHFLCLHVAISLLSRCTCSEDIEYADSLLKYFVETFIVLYGSQNVSHNIHNLLHVCQDVQQLGSIEKFSAFPFENFMQSLKKLARKDEKPLQQIVRRISEQDFFPTKSQVSSASPQLNHEHFSGPLLDATATTKQYKNISFGNFILSTSEPNNCCSLIGSDNNIVIIKNILLKDNEIFIIGQMFLHLEDFYSTPCSSSQLGIYLASNFGNLKSWNIKMVSKKCMKLDYNDKYVIIPLLHL